MAVFEHSRTAKYFVAAAVALAIIVGIYVWLQQRHVERSAAEQQAGGEMTAAEKAYLPEVVVTGAKMSAATNFLGDTVYYLDGALENKGAETVRQLTLKLAFMDPFGEVVLVESRSPVTHKTAPLKGGATQTLHMVFERLPATWNQGPPTITTTFVNFH